MLQMVLMKLIWSVFHININICMLAHHFRNLPFKAHWYYVNAAFFLTVFYAAIPDKCLFLLCGADVITTCFLARVSEHLRLCLAGIQAIYVLDEHDRRLLPKFNLLLHPLLCKHGLHFLSLTCSL